MISLRIQTLAAVATAAASLLGGAAHAGAPLCADPSSCAGGYRPASPAYAFAPPGPAYTDAGPAYEGRAYEGHEQARRPAGFVGYDRASRGPARPAPVRTYGGDPRTWGPAATLPPPPYAAAGYGEAAYVQGGGYAEAGYSARYAETTYGRGPGPAHVPAYAPGPGYGPGPIYGQPGPLPADCADTCVPAYALAPYVPAREVISLPGESYSGGVGVTEFSGGGGGGYGGNFEVQGFGDVSAFTSNHAQAQANAVANAQSLAVAKVNASASASSTTKVNVSLNAGFFGGGKGGYMKPGKGGCDTCGQPKPKPVADCGCNGVGGGKGGGYGMAPMARGWGGKRH